VAAGFGQIEVDLGVDRDNAGWVDALLHDAHHDYAFSLRQAFVAL
jgi:hypothetical protein